MAVEIIANVAGLGNSLNGITTVIDKNTTFTGAIENIARYGVAKVKVVPTASSDNISTGFMRMAEVDLSAASIIDNTGGGGTIGHVIAGYDYLKVTGANNLVLGIVNEAKFKKVGNGTVAALTFYKPAIDDIEGTVTTLKMYDAEMDLTGISGTVTTAYSFYSPDADKVALQKGGLIQNAYVVVDNLTLTDKNSGATHLMFAGVAKTITAPATLSPGFSARFIKGDAFDYSFAASGGNTLFDEGNNGYTKINALYGWVDLAIATSTTCFIRGSLKA